MNRKKSRVQGLRSKVVLPGLRSLPVLLRKRLVVARRLASKKRVPLYLVGGAVRDLLLGRPVTDLDLAVEGDGVAFSRALAREVGARPRVHARFGTVTLEFVDGSRLDVASTRSETYEARGALPRVAAAPIAGDLARRDFTINAIALRLAPERRPAVIDPFGGAEDLARRTVRMLHEASPQDDPTRAFRAVRYANRLGFRIEARTRAWIRRAIGLHAFDAVSGDRIRRELRLLFSEGDHAGALRLMGSLGLDRAVDPALRHDPRTLTGLRRAEAIARRRPGATTWLLFLIVWSGSLDAGERQRLSRRLSLSGEQARALASFPSLLRDLEESSFRAAPSRLLAGGHSPDEIAAAAALLEGPGGRKVERALDVFSTRLEIGGRDLIAAGIIAGPSIGQALKLTLAARRDRKISKRQELAFALREARREVAP